MEQDSLATELLKQIKADKKRWFIIALVELFIIFAITGIFIWYISLPVEDGNISQSADDNSYNQIVGGDVYGGETDNIVQEESSSQ